MSYGVQEGETTTVIAVENCDRQSSNLWRSLSGNRAFVVGHARGWSDLEIELRDGRYEVAVLQGGVGNESAFEMNESIKMSTANQVATILVAGQNTVGAARKAFRCGFSEYLPAGNITEHELHVAVQYAASVARDRKKELDRRKILEKAARHDGTTGLPNEHHFLDRAQQLIAVSQRYQKGFAVILLRINEIANIVARFGVKTGEKALFSCAAELRNNARGSDTYGRFDTETFFYLVDSLDAGLDLDSVRQRLAEALSHSLNVDELSMTLTADTAIAVYPQDGETVADLIEKAKASLGTPETEALINMEVSAARNDAVLRDENRREHKRHRVFKRGTLVFNNGFSTIDCTIKDLSDGGARVAIEGGFSLPDRLELVIVESGRKFSVQKRWQTDRQTGLMFIH